jgi:hypothetical protein
MLVDTGYVITSNPINNVNLNITGWLQTVALLILPFGTCSFKSGVGSFMKSPLLMASRM